MAGSSTEEPYRVTPVVRPAPPWQGPTKANRPERWHSRAAIAEVTVYPEDSTPEAAALGAAQHAEMLARHGDHPAAPIWQAYTLAPVNKQQPATPFFIIPPDGRPRRETLTEREAQAFHGFQFHLYGVEDPHSAPSAYQWTYRDQHVINVLRLSI